MWLCKCFNLWSSPIEKHLHTYQLRNPKNIEEPLCNLPIQVGGEDMDWQPTNGVYTHPSYKRYLPCVAFLDLTFVGLRRDLICNLVGKKAQPDNPRMRLRRRQAEPEYELHDPYIAAVLISLAQLRRTDIRVRLKTRENAVRRAQARPFMSTSARRSPAPEHHIPDRNLVEPPDYPVCCITVTLFLPNLMLSTTGRCLRSNIPSGKWSAKRPLPLQVSRHFGFLGQVRISIKIHWGCINARRVRPAAN